MFGLFNKKKEQQKRQLFSDVIEVAVASYASKKKFYKDIYEIYFEDALADDTTSELWEQLPELKTRYKQALGNLVSISENNTVFFTTAEEMEKIDILERTKKIKDDIIKTIPYLIEFSEIYNILVSNLYNRLYKIEQTSYYVWAGLKYSKEDLQATGTIGEHRRTTYQSCLDQIQLTYQDCAIKEAWGYLVAKHPESTSQSDMTLFLEIANSHTSAQEKWMALWIENMQKIHDEDYHFGPAWNHLAGFIKNTNAEFGNPAWFEYPLQAFDLGVYSSFPGFNSKTHDKNELMRIQKLYIEGKMLGKYSPYSDPDLYPKN